VPRLSKSYGGQQQHPPGSSGSEEHTVRRTNSQLHQSMARESMSLRPNSLKAPIIHISLLCCEAYYLTRHISHVFDIEGIRIAIHVHSTDLCVVFLSHRISLPKIKSSEMLLSTSMPKVVRRDRENDF